jgi:AraC-like DNA-binding protein
MESQPSPSVASGPASRDIAQGRDWSVSEYVCTAGPHDRPFEEQHGVPTIAVVVEGSFRYRSHAGSALLYPGSFLLGDAGRCFTCGHEHSTGDRCIGFQFAPALFDEIAATVTGARRFRFPAAMLPAVREVTAPVVDIEAMARSGDALAAEETAMRVAETVIAAVSGTSVPRTSASPGDERRMSRVLRHIDENASEPVDLDQLAGVAAMSKYHFLRAFRRTTGLTPHQFLLGVRMRRAAVQLRTTIAPVSAVAFAAGFGDLSTFNGRFRDIFGMSPRDFRKSRGRKAIRSAA